MGWAKGTTTSRGYGSQHQKTRAVYLARWRPGDPCARCGKPMWGPTTKIHLGHTDDRTGYIGLEHDSCNTADGARRANATRPKVSFGGYPHQNPRCRTCGQTYNYSGKQCMICGRHYHPSRKVQYTCGRACGLQYKRLNGLVARVWLCEVCSKPCGRHVRTCGQPQCIDELRQRQRKTLTCQHCGKKFAGRAAQYCSTNCASLAYYARFRVDVLGKLADRRRADGVPARPPGKRRTPERCPGCGGQVWRSDLNRVGDGWMCAPCRRRSIDGESHVTVNQSRVW